MARRNLPVRHMQAQRPAIYVDPQMAAELEFWRTYALNPAELVRRQQRNTELYLRWKTRQAEIKERDRKFRRVFLGIGMVIGLALVAGLAIGGWLLWTGLGLGVLAVPVVLLAAGGLAVGGHRCITIVQHMH